MIDHIIGILTNFIISVIGQTGYIGIFILMALESACIPIPSEVTMPFAGYLASTGKFNLYAVIAVGTVANLFGSLLAYWVGKYGGDVLIRALIHKYGKFFLVTMDEFEKSEKWFRKYGQNVVFFSRVLPVIRTFISLPAGVASMNLPKFILLTLIGSAIWSAFLTYIGFTLGKNWHSIEGIYRKFEYAIIAVVVIAIIWYIWHKVQKLRKKHR